MLMPLLEGREVCFTCEMYPNTLVTTQMTGRLMQESRVSLHDWLTMKKRRKARRPVYHMTRLSSSLRASLIVLVFVVTCDTSSPERERESVTVSLELISCKKSINEKLECFNLACYCQRR